MLCIARTKLRFVQHQNLLPGDRDKVDNMFYYTYVLQRKQNDDLYIGYTTDLRRRISEHNSGKNFSTKNKGLWQVIFYEAYLDADDAMRREKYLKSSQGSRLLKRMLKEYFYKRRI